MKWISAAPLFTIALTSFAADSDFPSPVKWQPDERAVSSGIYIQPHAAAKHEKVEFTVTENAGVARKHAAVRGAVSLYRGELSDPSKVRLLDAKGKEVPVQAKITAFWPEKTARFLCLDFLIDLAANAEAKFTLEYGAEVKAAPSSAMKVSEKAGAIDLDTGLVKLAVMTGNDFLAVTLPKQSKPLSPITGQTVICTDERGSSPTAIPLTIDEVSIAEQGPVQTTVHLSGHFGPDKSGPPPQLQEETWKYPVSIYLRAYAGTGHVYVEHCFGYNGNEYKEFVKSYGLTIPTGLSKGKFTYGPDDSGSAEAPLGVRLNQYAHNEWTLSGKAEAKGKRFGGWGAIVDGANTVMVGLRDGWQNWPVAIRAEANGDLVCEIMGDKTDRALDLRYEDRSKKPTVINKSHSMYVGEALDWDYYNDESPGTPGSDARGLMKIHELFIDFAPATAPADVAKGFQKLLLPWVDQKRIADSKVLGHIAVYGDPKYDWAKEYFCGLLDSMTMVHESNGLYGWVDWGDVPMVGGADDNKVQPIMAGGQGWSNGERAVAGYIYHYLAGGGRRYIDLGRAFVHHTIGIDVDHAGGNDWRGGYLRHNQAHWRHVQSCRQGGFRGWHAYYWLTGDPEVGRLAILEGIDSPAGSTCLNVKDDASLRVLTDWQGTSNQSLAYCCWVTTGNWRYVRLHHAIAKMNDIALSQGRMIDQGWNFMVPDKNGEPTGFNLGGPGCWGAGYWFTYGGDDVMVDWASLTGDPAAVDTLRDESRLWNGGGASYHSPDGLYAGMALLTHDPKLHGLLAERLAQQPMLQRFKNENRKLPATYKSPKEWWDLVGQGMAGKNGNSIYGGQAADILMWMFADSVIGEDPLPVITLPTSARVEEGKKAAVISVDGSASKKRASDIVKYEWIVDGKPAGSEAKCSIEVVSGPHIVTLKVVDAKGRFGTISQPLTVWPSDVVYQLCFNGGPSGYIEAMRPFNEQDGYGWIKGGIEHDTNYPPNLGESRGCGNYISWYGAPHIYQLKLPPGTYHLELGGSTTITWGYQNVQVNDKILVPGVINTTRGAHFAYDGDLTVGADGLVKITFVQINDESGKPKLHPEGATVGALISYITVKKK